MQQSSHKAPNYRPTANEAASHMGSFSSFGPRWAVTGTQCSLWGRQSQSWNTEANSPVSETRAALSKGGNDGATSPPSSSVSISLHSPVGLCIPKCGSSVFTDAHGHLNQKSSWCPMRAGVTDCSGSFWKSGCNIVAYLDLDTVYLFGV